MKSGTSYLFNTVEVVAQYNTGMTPGDGSWRGGRAGKWTRGRIPFGKKTEAIKQ